MKMEEIEYSENSSYKIQVPDINQKKEYNKQNATPLV
jgi:hypothetical protein